MLHNHLEHYQDIVDATVLVESSLTFSSKPKPLYFHNNREEFRGNNIIWTKYSDKHESDPWLREFGQRNKALDAVKFGPDDFLLVNDTDEFVNLETLERVIMGLKNLGETAMPVCFIMDHYQGSFRYQIPEPWPGTVLIPMRTIHYKPSTYRDQRARLPLIQTGGWHLSYFGGVDKIQQKIAAYAHMENNTPEINNKDRIRKALEEGTRII